MTGLLVLLVLIGLALGVMRLAGLRGPALTIAAAALMAGGAGYALQGRPGLGGSAGAGRATQDIVVLDKQREAFFGKFYSTEHWLILSDSLARRGRTEEAVKIIQSGLREHPRDYALWTGLANAITDHGRGLTPAAQFAFDRARKLAPTAAGPAYFLGLAQLRSGNLAAARTTWGELLASSPAEARWRPMVENGLRVIDAIEAADTQP
jgi:cytochrome c-type biogenesis protein CcmH